MKKWILYLALLFALAETAGIPKTRADVAKLHPVALLRITKENQKILVQTDTGESGEGMTLEEAFQDLKLTVPGRIYLNTSKYIVLGRYAEDVMEPLQKIIDGSCMLCREEGETDPEKAAPYLAAHKPEMTVGKYRGRKEEIPILSVQDGKMRLLQPKKKT